MKKKQEEMTTAITITYDTQKLAALEMYIKGEGDMVTQEPQATMERLYNRHVPSYIKQYIAIQKQREEEKNYGTQG